MASYNNEQDERSAISGVDEYNFIKAMNSEGTPCAFLSFFVSYL